MLSIRDLRETKMLSQDKVAAAAGVTYNVFVRIEEGSGKTTPEQVAHVLHVLQGMDPGTRKLAGRPFKNPQVRALVAEARKAGESVSAVLGHAAPAAPVVKVETETATQRKARLARERRAAKKLLL